MSGLTKLIAGAALVSCALAAAQPPGNSYAARRQDEARALQQGEARALTDRERAIRVSITTGGGLFGPPKDSFRVGQRVPVTITMTNTSDEPVQVCDSSTLYQDRPRLLRDGQPVPYLTGQAQILRTVEEDKTCQKLDLPEPITLQPKESKVVDWFILAGGSEPVGDMTWYEPLRAGRYELSLRRRLRCCDGPLAESDKISFEVVP